MPHGYLADFIKLEQFVQRSSDRSLRNAASISDAEAQLLEANTKIVYDSNLSAATAVDQLLDAADLKPRRWVVFSGKALLTFSFWEEAVEQVLCAQGCESFKNY